MSDMASPVSIQRLSCVVLVSVCLLSGCGGGGGSTAATAANGDAGATAPVSGQPVAVAPETSAADMPASDGSGKNKPILAGVSTDAEPVIKSDIAPLLSKPAAGETGVAIGASIVVAYDGQINMAVPPTVTLKGPGGNVPGQLTVSSGTIIFTPLNSLVPGNVYSFSTIAEVTRDGSASLKAATTIAFATGQSV